MIQTFLSISWPCAAAALRLLQMCDLCDNGVLQMPSTCPWCSSPVTVRGYSLYMQLENYTTHLKDHASCVGMYTSVVDNYGSVQEQAVPTVKGLLSDADLRRANEYSSDYVTIYISVNGHRQWPSMGQPLINFISTLIGNARVAFIQEMIALRKKQAHAQANNLDIPKKYWTATCEMVQGHSSPPCGPSQRATSFAPLHDTNLQGCYGRRCSRAKGLCGLKWSQERTGVPHLRLLSGKASGGAQMRSRWNSGSLRALVLDCQ